MNVRLIAVALCLLPWLPGCQPAEKPRFQGYVEGEPVLIAAQQTGQLTSLNVQRGDIVAMDTPLFSQDQATEAANVSQARAQLAQAEAQLANLARGKRPQEIAVIEAQLKDAEAKRRLSSAQLTRQQALLAKGFVSPEALDSARTQAARDEAAVAQMKAQLASAELPGREQERAAARAQVAAAKEGLQKYAILLAQKSQRAPVAGLVQDTYFRTGEWVGPGQAVLALLPPENIKVRFFVPETELTALKTGQAVQIHVDGSATPIAATIRYISPSAEYTPPVLFSEKNRHRLVYLVEAWPKPADAPRLHPGQPVSVSRQ